MIREPNCFKRKCLHFVGVVDTETPKERCVCKAFPDGIPIEIAYGKNKHLKPYRGDNDIQYKLNSNKG